MTAGDKPRRPVSEEEQALWRAVTRSISPLKRRRERAGAAEATPKPDAVAEPRPRPSAAAKPSTPPKPAAPSPKAPPLAEIDRRARQRLARGTDSIDGRLDLHGRTQAQAHAVLLRFLRHAQADGARTVLVITGKGDATAGERGERGVLKRQVPLWLALPEFRGLVVGFSDAGIGHGGQGALYVRLRKARA